MLVCIPGELVDRRREMHRNPARHIHRLGVDLAKQASNAADRGRHISEQRAESNRPSLARREQVPVQLRGRSNACRQAGELILPARVVLHAPLPFDPADEYLQHVDQPVVELDELALSECLRRLRVGEFRAESARSVEALVITWQAGPDRSFTTGRPAPLLNAYHAACGPIGPIRPRLDCVTRWGGGIRVGSRQLPRVRRPVLPVTDAGMCVIACHARLLRGAAIRLPGHVTSLVNLGPSTARFGRRGTREYP